LGRVKNGWGILLLDSLLFLLLWTTVNAVDINNTAKNDTGTEPFSYQFEILVPVIYC
jgi:hypothetical protein